MIHRYRACRSSYREEADPPATPSKRPGRASIAEAEHCREVHPDAPVLVVALEANLRRTTLFDYGMNPVRRSLPGDGRAHSGCRPITSERNYMDRPFPLARSAWIMPLAGFRSIVFSLLGCRCAIGSQTPPAQSQQTQAGQQEEPCSGLWDLDWIDPVLTGVRIAQGNPGVGGIVRHDLQIAPRSGGKLQLE